MAAPAPLRVLILGDSITDGYGLDKKDAFPAALSELLKKSGRSGVELIVAGVSGATSASGPSSLSWQLKQAVPSIIVLELGANDGLRALSAKEMKKNLKATIDLAKKNGIRVLLAGMKAPPNYGKTYGSEFEAVFKDLAHEEKIYLIPFVLAGVAGERDLNQEDLVHPNERGAKIVAATVFKYLEPLL